MIDISIKIDGKNKGMMGMSLEDMLDKPVIVKKKRKKKKSILKTIASSIPKKSEYTTEIN
jgi:hypothetical protein